MEKKIIEYLKNLYSIEKTIYEEEEVRRLLFLKRDRTISYYKLKETSYSNYPKTSYLSAIIYSVSAIICALISVLLVSQNEWKECFESVVLLLLAVILGLCGIVKYFNLREMARQENEERIRNGKIIEENRIIRQKNEIIRLQADKNRISAETQIKLIDSALAETKALRDKYYELDIIHPKYRKDFVAISSIYEFMDTGRCYKLTGPHGAYDTFEYMKELREIKTNLKVIISQLEEIKRNQWMLYDAISESNRLTQVMIDEFQRTEKQLIQANRSLSEIGEYQRQSAEYNRITAGNSEFLKWYTIFDRASVVDTI